MIRLFEQHHIRQVQELDGMWEFRMEGFEGEYQLPVPGCWEQHPDFLAHRGRGEYRKKIYVKNAGNLRLEFKGVSHTADVSFDWEGDCQPLQRLHSFFGSDCRCGKGRA